MEDAVKKPQWEIWSDLLSLPVLSLEQTKIHTDEGRPNSALGQGKVRMIAPKITVWMPCTL